MALHRDIFWIGRQWAVTGLGMQAVNQKLLGQFDIEIARLWDDSWLDVLRAQQWLNAEDFAKGLAVARKRFPEPAHKPPPLPIEALLQVIAAPTAPPQPKPAPEAAAPKVVEPEKPLALPGAGPILQAAAIAAVELERPVPPQQAEPLREPLALDAIEPAMPTPSFLQMSVAAPSARLLKIWRIRQP